ncbi:MAG: uncharacterized protein JWO89_2556 [Verrucomicrobiaceae bacterium]|nr:uncharacterized protein [Verrucomicrobiaceae bacterium]
MRGVIKELRPESKEVVIKHDDIHGYMDAMTMPFAVRDTSIMKDLRVVDGVKFLLKVTKDDGWIERFDKLKSAPAAPPPPY